jgi:hypothetical protein
VYLPDADGRWAEREVEVEVVRELTPLHLGQRPLGLGPLLLRRVLVVIEGHGEWLVEPNRLRLSDQQWQQLRRSPKALAPQVEPEPEKLPTHATEEATRAVAAHKRRLQRKRKRRIERGQEDLLYALLQRRKEMRKHDRS